MLVLLHERYYQKKKVEQTYIVFFYFFFVYSTQGGKIKIILLSSHLQKNPFILQKPVCTYL